MAGGSKTDRRLAGVEAVRTESELFTAGTALLGQRPESGHSDPQVSSAISCPPDPIDPPNLPNSSDGQLSGQIHLDSGDTMLRQKLLR
jgi:hypothetical protein